MESVWQEGTELINSIPFLSNHLRTSSAVCKDSTGFSYSSLNQASFLVFDLRFLSSGSKRKTRKPRTTRETQEVQSRIQKIDKKQKKELQAKHNR